MCAWECKTWYIWNPLARGAVHKQTLQAALLEFQLIANSLFSFVYSTFLALCRTMASGNFLHVTVILKLSHLCLSRTFTWYFEEAIILNTSYQCRSCSHVCESHSNFVARDGVWRWSTAWYVLFFPVLWDDTGWKQLAFVLLSAFEAVHSYLATSLEVYSCLGGRWG